MAMLTVTVLGTPNLGNSFTKAAQRIAGVMIGELVQHWQRKHMPGQLPVCMRSTRLAACWGFAMP
jgi:hypothetical protein